MCAFFCVLKSGGPQTILRETLLVANDVPTIVDVLLQISEFIFICHKYASEVSGTTVCGHAVKCHVMMVNSPEILHKSSFLSKIFFRPSSLSD